MHFYFDEATQMLAEKFFLLLETLRSHSYPNGGPRVVSTSPHVPVKPAGAKQG
jgi:hypothetical protein